MFFISPSLLRALTVSNDPLTRQLSSVIHPSHEWNLVLKHNSVLGEDVLLGPPVYDVTAVANSETVTVYKVPKSAWAPFRPLMVQER